MVEFLLTGVGAFAGMFVSDKLTTQFAKSQKEGIRNNASIISSAIVLAIGVIVVISLKNKWIRALASGIGAVGIATLLNVLIAKRTNNLGNLDNLNDLERDVLEHLRRSQSVSVWV